MERAGVDRRPAAIGIVSRQDERALAGLVQGDPVSDDARERVRLPGVVDEDRQRAAGRSYRAAALQSANRLAIAVQVERAIDGHHPGAVGAVGQIAAGADHERTAGHDRNIDRVGDGIVEGHAVTAVKRERPVAVDHARAPSRRSFPHCRPATCHRAVWSH